MEKAIDLRSDTVTKPSEEMRKAMFEAEVGDDVFKEDPTVNKLEEYAADLLGFEAALFVPSGVMGNQLCLNVHTNPGDEIICERDTHIVHYESGSPAALSGIQLMLINGENGIMTAGQIEEAVRPVEAYYMPRTKLIEIENTHNRAGGTIQPLEEIEKISKIAKKHKLKMHLDGARLWNAHIASGVELKRYTQYFDSVSCCLSKGLGAPVGSVIAGSKKFIKEAYRVRKGWGGGMRQAGILAAAGLFALENNINRLSEDHEKAKQLARGLNEIKGIEVDPDSVQTNIVMFKLKKKKTNKFLISLSENGVKMIPGSHDKVRAVTHMDVSFADMFKTLEIINVVIDS